MSRAARVILFHLPLLVCFLIAFASSSDLGVFRSLRTESSYGVWVVVLMPLAAMAALTQIVLWIVWTVRRARRTGAE